MPKRPTELPRLGASTADTHAHLEMLDDPAGAIERAAMAGIDFIVTVVDVTETPEGTFDLLDSWIGEAQERLAEWELPDVKLPDVRIILGAHPHNAKDFDQAAEERMLAYVADPRVVGIGEIGLDFHYDHSPRIVQRHAFRKQLDGAHRCGLPAIVHLREAHEEGLGILKDVGMPDAGCVIHCFTGDAELVREFIDMGCYISFAGPVTFKNADAIRTAVAAVPLDRLLVETDCPFMAPEPYRGMANEPAWAVLTAAKVAEVRGIEPEVLAKATLENARRIFADDRPSRA